MGELTDAGRAYLAMMKEEALGAGQIAGVDYGALKEEHDIDNLVQYFVDNADSLSQHDPKIGQAVEYYSDRHNMITEKIRGTSRYYLYHQEKLRMLESLGYKGSARADFMGVPTIDATDPYWDEFGKNAK